jgi:flagellar motility protein MotE (MotC chaperone)
MRLIISSVIAGLILCPLLEVMAQDQEGKGTASEGTTQEAGSDADKKEGSKAAKDQKVYSEDEFRKELKERVGKKLRQLGQGKIVKFAQELMEKEEQLAVQKLEVRKDKEQFSNNVQTFEDRVKAFELRQQKLLGCIKDSDKKENRRIDHMVEVISGMKPMNAAQVLSVQEAEITIKILGKLSPTKVSKIFNLMDKEISARLQKQYLTMKR